MSLDLGFGCVVVEAYRRERRVALRVAVEIEAEYRRDGRRDMVAGYWMYKTLRSKTTVEMSKTGNGFDHAV